MAANFKKLLVGFGFPYWEVRCIRVLILFYWKEKEAPGEAEAKLAMLSGVGHIDAVMSEDFDAMVFGAQHVIWMWAATVQLDPHRF